MAVEVQYRVAVHDGLVLSVKYGIAVLFAGIVYGLLAGATWIVRDYLAVRQHARNGQQAAIYLINQQQEQANVLQETASTSEDGASGDGNAGNASRDSSAEIAP